MFSSEEDCSVRIGAQYAGTLGQQHALRQVYDHLQEMMNHLPKDVVSEALEEGLVWGLEDAQARRSKASASDLVEKRWRESVQVEDDLNT